MPNAYYLKLGSATEQVERLKRRNRKGNIP